MAVIQTKLLQAGVSGSAKGAESNTVQASYRLRYQVRVDDANPNPTTVLEHFRTTADLPWIGDRFQIGSDFDATAICKAIDPELIERSGGLFNVPVVFEPSESNADQKNVGIDPAGKTTGDPLKWHHDIDVSFTPISVPVEFATFRGFTNAREANRFMRPGVYMALQNSAGVAFDPPIEDDIPIKVIRISKNVPFYDDFAFNLYQGAVNSDNVIINKPDYRFKTQFGPYFGKIVQLGATFGVENGIKYFRQTLEIWVNPLGWRRSILDRGTDQRAAEGDTNADGGIISPSDINPGDAFHRKILGADGAPIVAPVNLDGNGKPLDPRFPAVYGVWSTRHEIPFMPLRGTGW
jgi:hypothetical protein